MRVFFRAIMVALSVMALHAANGIDAHAHPTDDPPEFEPPDLDEGGAPEIEEPNPNEGEGSEAELPEVEALHEGHGEGGRREGEDDDRVAGGSVESHWLDPMDVERDAGGLEYVADEVLIAASKADIARAEAAGYRVISIVKLGGSDRQMARLLVPTSRSVQQGIAELQALAPGAIVTINNAYRSTWAGARPTRTRMATRRQAAPGGLVGVIDTGAYRAAAANGLAATRGFGSAGYAPREHGSAVVSIVTQMGARVQVADVFGPTRSREPYAAASAIVAALQWMVETGVPVINISIEGPRNAILESAIRDATRAGHVVVASAGNGGPLAQPAFPGAYDGVVAVTAVDSDGRAYLRANRGDYVDFAALGVRVPVDTGKGSVSVSGTSFAAPIVAAKIAQQLHEPSVAAAAQAVQILRNHAIDRGQPGRDAIYGWGEVLPD